MVGALNIALGSSTAVAFSTFFAIYLSGELVGHSVPVHTVSWAHAILSVLVNY